MGSAEHRSDDARDPPAAGAHEDLLASLAAGAAGAAASLPAYPVAGASTDASLAAAASAHADLRMNLEAALESPAFPGEFAGTIESLAMQGIEHAELVVNPPELGPIRISMSMDADTLSIAFASEHVETRQAIERSLPALQAALKEHGSNWGTAARARASTPAAVMARLRNARRPALRRSACAQPATRPLHRRRPRAHRPRRPGTPPSGDCSTCSPDIASSRRGRAPPAHDRTHRCIAGRACTARCGNARASAPVHRRSAPDRPPAPSAPKCPASPGVIASPADPLVPNNRPSTTEL
jgi:hypothetical protein